MTNEIDRIMTQVRDEQAKQEILNILRAFPEPRSLRDYFAGQALAGMGRQEFCDPDAVALECYAYADAMLAARERQQEQKGG